MIGMLELWRVRPLSGKLPLRKGGRKMKTGARNLMKNSERHTVPTKVVRMATLQQQ
jgi:hypothetical protein